MNSNCNTEHFVTLFNNKFLPMGICLHTSLINQKIPFHLWILCVDKEVEKNLKILSLPNVSLIPLKQVETIALLNVKKERTIAEYCWTLTPFAPQFVFKIKRGALKTFGLKTKHFRHFRLSNSAWCQFKCFS